MVSLGEVNVEGALRDLGLGPVPNGVRYLMSCPWPENHKNGDEHPSFSVFVDNGYWRCFTGCGHGELSSLVGRLKGLTPMEARRWLLVRGSGQPSYDVDSYLYRADGSKDVPEDLRVLYERDYSRQLTDRTSSYILDRGFTHGTLVDWGFRYDPVLRAIVIPIFSIESQLVGVIRRQTDPAFMPAKYMYSPGFSRNHHLFGAYKHSRVGPTILVEGPLDAIWLHQHGYLTAVSLLGSFCSRQQERLLATLSDRVILAMDSDEAGEKAVKHLIQQLSGKLIISRIRWPVGTKDAQDLTKEELNDVFRGRA